MRNSYIETLLPGVDCSEPKMPARFDGINLSRMMALKQDVNTAVYLVFKNCGKLVTIKLFVTFLNFIKICMAFLLLSE